MKLEDKIKVQQKIIAELTQDKECLEKKNKDLQFDLDFFKLTYNESLQKAKDMIVECSRLKKEYEEAIDGANRAKSKYNQSIKEVYKLKREYLDKYEKLLKQL